MYNQYDIMRIGDPCNKDIFNDEAKDWVRTSDAFDTDIVQQVSGY